MAFTQGLRRMQAGGSYSSSLRWLLVESSFLPSWDGDPYPHGLFILGPSESVVPPI